MSKIESFENKKIRTVWCESKQKWYFVISDIVLVLTKTADSIDYTKKIRRYDRDLAKVWSQIAVPLEVVTNGGRQKINCADALGILRIIQSIRSPKIKLFRKWLNSLKIDPFKKPHKIKFSEKTINEFYKILSNPDNWIEKRNQISFFNENQPSRKIMNDLELIFILLEEDDIFYQKRKRKGEKAEMQKPAGNAKVTA